MVKLESVGQSANAITTKIINTISNNEKFVEFLSKASPKIQDAVLDVMIKMGDDGFAAINFSENLLVGLRLYLN